MRLMRYQISGRNFSANIDMNKKEILDKKKQLKEFEKQFFLKYSEHYCDCIAFLNNQWHLIKQLIEVQIGLKDDKDICGSEVMMAAMHINDLEQQYGPFLEQV